MNTTLPIIAFALSLLSITSIALCINSSHFIQIKVKTMQCQKIFPLSFIEDHDAFSCGNSVRISCIQNKLMTYSQLILDRSNTMKFANFAYSSSEGSEQENQNLPLHAGAKTNLTLFLLALGYKWYRSIFINKLAIWERQPQWNTVITSKEDEKKANLEAMTCNECGSIIFIAKGRKWFQMPNGYKCYCCGASGEEMFSNTREELLEEIEDDYFDYEKPLDFVTAAERRSLMKKTGGDEAKANEILSGGENALSASNDTESSGDSGKEKNKYKNVKIKKKRKEDNIKYDVNCNNDKNDKNGDLTAEIKVLKSEIDDLGILEMD